MENYYFINSVDPENQMMRIQEVGAGEMSAQQVSCFKRKDGIDEDAADSFNVFALRPRYTRNQTL